MANFRSRIDEDHKLNLVRNDAPLLLAALEMYIKANKELESCEYCNHVEINLARRKLSNAEKYATDVIKKAKGTV